MKIGVTIPNHFGIEDPRQMLAFGPLAEVSVLTPSGLWTICCTPVLLPSVWVTNPTITH